MNHERVVITGIGVISPIGIGRPAFFEGLRAGASGIAPLTLFDSSGIPSPVAGQVDYDPAELLGSKGLRYLSRSTKWMQCATALAIAEAGLNGEEVNTSGWALVVGTAFGSLQSITEFDHEALRNGPASVNPMSFPNTVINAPAGQTAIRFGLTGPNTTISTGSVAGVHALGYAADLIRNGGAEVVLAGGAEELCEASFRGFHQAGLLSGSEPMPFDRRRRGMVMGEGSVIVVLESEESAQQRGARICGEVCGFGESFGPGGLEPAILTALDEAGMKAVDVNLISASACGSVIGDAEEARAIQKLFRGHSVAVHAVKGGCGEALGASGALQAASGLFAIAEQAAPPTPQFQEVDPESPMDGMLSSATAWRTDTVAVTASNLDGNHGVVILKKYARGEEH